MQKKNEKHNLSQANSERTNKTESKKFQIEDKMVNKKKIETNTYFAIAKTSKRLQIPCNRHLNAQMLILD